MSALLWIIVPMVIIFIGAFTAIYSTDGELSELSYMKKGLAHLDTVDLFSLAESAKRELDFSKRRLKNSMAGESGIRIKNAEREVKKNKRVLALIVRELKNRGAETP